MILLMSRAVISRLAQVAVFRILQACVKESCETVLLCGKCDEESLQQMVAKHPVQGTVVFPFRAATVCRVALRICINIWDYKLEDIFKC